MRQSPSPKRSLNELIERSSLGSPQARAVRQTIPSEVAAKLVARSATRGARLGSSTKKTRRG
ncbi:hypothetical protein SAMN05660748_3708 [Blastococcus aggregatus]|uniref:Uncharacterized protein n=1 Tax=Blastococcus aggregatus TaxID=38502 RepID=A0A285VA46_9ACTN|nr:hypothetical protein SAMN05660748_3708 [Blastococcus aggregatus]